MDSLPEEDTRQLVKEACIEANADSFIQGLAEGYDTKVGERAGFISGGQKQRIAIARSIISNPRILLLDEATSALDPKAEGVVQAALDRVSQTRTTVMIAHKLSTVQKADKIIVMNQGRVIEQGTHESLLATGGAYSRLVNAQNLNAEDESESKDKVENGDGGDAGDLDLAKVQTTRSTTSVQSALKSEEVARKLSLFRCLVIIFYEQRHLWQLLLGGFVACVAAGAVFPAQAVLFSRVVTVFQLPESLLQSKGNFWALMFFVLALGTLASYASLGFFLTVAAFLITRFYRSEYFGAMLRQDIAFYDLEGNSSGALTARLSTDPQRLQDLVSSNIGLILIVIVNLLGSCTLALAVGWKLALVAIFGCLPPLFFAGFMRMRLEMKSQDKNAAMYQESARFASEAVAAIRTVSSLTLESKVLDNYAKRLDHSVKKAYKHIAVTMCLFGLSESLDLVAMGLAFWYGGKLLFKGEYNPTDFFLVFVAIIFGGQAAGFLFGFTLNTTKAHAAANHILHLRQQKPPINSSTGIQVPSDDTEVTIEFKNVRFAYPTRPEFTVIRGLNLKIHRGQSIGFVGASGCGKTTVITLLERFYDITSGQILIHGQQLSDLDVKSYRATVGLVSQDTTLYQGSLRENILLGVDEDVSEEVLIQACRDANIHDFITSLPEGYDTDAGSRGLALSGGQRQRIAIARALVRNPTILLLDEATSALDTQSEKVVQQALETAARGRTTVAVAHRLSTVRGTDCIFVLDAGKVVEQGTHAELVRRRGRYYEMVQAQSLDREAK
jgi:ATP-binding cassette, subfamily B (MDR/TAP), member 1